MDLKKGLIVQDEADQSNPVRPAELMAIAQLKTYSDCACTHDSGIRNMASDDCSKCQGQNHIFKSLTQAFLPSMKRSPAIDRKIAEFLDNMLMGDLLTDVVKESADKYSLQENTQLLNV